MVLDNLQSPCFIINNVEFERGIRCFNNALKSKFRNVQIGYSVKTNSLPYALRQARKLGCMVEVVSYDEYRLARLCGFSPHEIIYNGPMKSRETFIEAVTNGAIVNIETKRELKWIEELPKGHIYNVGIRLNINISKVSPEDADGTEDNSRFGFSDESGEFAQALDCIASTPSLRLAGLHIHRTAHSRSPRFYNRSVAYAASVINKYKLNIDYLDVGGGYFGIFTNKPTFEDYAEAFYNPLAIAGLENLKIIVEPGNAITASAFQFLSEVIDIKKIDDDTVFVTTDGSRNDIDPFFHKTDYLKEILYKDTCRSIIPLQIVTGCTCLEYDRLFSLCNQPVLKEGDRILFNNVGAYTLTLTPQFIRLWPRVYALDKECHYTEIRRASSVPDILILDK